MIQFYFAFTTTEYIFLGLQLKMGEKQRYCICRSRDSKSFM